MEKIFYTPLQEAREALKVLFDNQQHHYDVSIDFESIYKIFLDDIRDTLINLNFCYFMDALTVDGHYVEGYDENRMKVLLDRKPAAINFMDWAEFATLMSKILTTNTLHKMLVSLVDDNEPSFMLFDITVNEQLLVVKTLPVDIRVLDWNDTRKSGNKCLFEIEEYHDLYVKWNRLYEEACPANP